MLIRRLEQSSRDVTDLLRLLMDMHATSGLDLPPLNMTKVLQSVWACEQTGVVFVAEKETDGAIVGALGIVEQAHWFSVDTFLADRFYYVRQGDRTSAAAVGLLNAAKKYASILQKPLSVSVWNGEDVARKDAFFERKGLRRVGGIYLTGLEKGGSD
jgi:hypothetical protein